MSNSEQLDNRPDNPIPYNLLVVDDRPDNLQVLSQLLRERYRIQVAISGDIALKAALVKPPDLILLDILMPRMDGYEVCRRLKEDSKTHHIPVLFLSALARIEDKIKGFEIGGADYITKPFQSEEVIARIEHQLAICALQRQLERNNRELEARNRQLEAEIQQRQQAERDLQQQNTKLDRTLWELQALQGEMIHREKMTALGRLVVAMTGEINDPLTMIRSAMPPMRAILDNRCFEFPQFFERLSCEQQTRFIALVENAAAVPLGQTKERRQLQRQIAQKLVDLDIADGEFKLASILVELGVGLDVESILPLLQDPDRDRILQVARTITKAHRSLENINVAVERTEAILKALSNYAGRDYPDTPAIADIAEGIEMVRALFKYRLPANIELVENYSPLPLVSCYPDQLSQVWTNLIENALEAMGDKGILTIETATSDNQVQISISNSRSELSPAQTLDSNPKTQMNLYICEKIVQKHRGTIFVENNPDRTIFTVSLPITSSTN
ncbi:response regulator [Oscillatoriales cyanobacterium LEGE 11467]|uniref:Response regulator n=1 Tax=Zarconia navalis LEGE 11467 TaxID=1828826 RepID=A0A928ZBC6_9CYAN|nr:response regulator [Zarconia navalis]MBE9042536.1 response regulator [Zarconia navalis LEGE 11467]